MDDKQNKKPFEEYNLEETKAWIKEMERVYEPFFEPGCISTDPKTGKEIIMQEDGSWKEYKKE